MSCDQACQTGWSTLCRALSWRTGQRWNGVKLGACAGPRRKGVGPPRPGEASDLAPLQRPQEATVMTLGRAEEFLSWDDGRGWGARRSCTPPC